MVSAESTASVALAVPIWVRDSGVFAAVASNVRSNGTVSAGAVVSLTVIAWAAVAEFPASSVALYSITVLPSPKVAVALLVMVGVESTASVDLAVPSCVADSGVFAAVASNVRAGGR